MSSTQVSYESSPGMHKHMCPKCCFTWEHSDSCLGDQAAHTCSECGMEQWMKYDLVSTCEQNAADTQESDSQYLLLELLNLMWGDRSQEIE